MYDKPVLSVATRFIGNTAKIPPYRHVVCHNLGNGLLLMSMSSELVVVPAMMAVVRLGVMIGAVNIVTLELNSASSGTAAILYLLEQLLLVRNQRL